MRRYIKLNQKYFTFQVYNLVPSISAITGISPGRYLWRVCIAFHLGPRLLIVATYYHFLLSFAPSLTTKGSAHKLTSLLNYCFYLQIIEILSLCTISFIHNREHYRKYSYFNLSLLCKNGVIYRYQQNEKKEKIYMILMIKLSSFEYSDTPKRFYLLHLLFALVISSHFENISCDLASFKRSPKVLI